MANGGEKVGKEGKGSDSKEEDSRITVNDYKQKT